MIDKEHKEKIDLIFESLNKVTQEDILFFASERDNLNLLLHYQQWLDGKVKEKDSYSIACFLKSICLHIGNISMEIKKEDFEKVKNENLF